MILDSVLTLLRRRQDRPLREGQYIDRMRALWEMEADINPLSTAQRDALLILTECVFMTPTDAMLHLGPKWRRTVSSLQDRGLAEFYNARIKITARGRKAVEKVRS